MRGRVGLLLSPREWGQWTENVIKAALLRATKNPKNHWQLVFSGNHPSKCSVSRVTVGTVAWKVAEGLRRMKDREWCPYWPGQGTSFPSPTMDLLEPNLYMNTDSTHFNPEDGGSVYLRNLGNTAPT
jgi:hypothetical protein